MFWLFFTGGPQQVWIECIPTSTGEGTRSKRDVNNLKKATFTSIFNKIEASHSVFELPTSADTSCDKRCAFVGVGCQCGKPRKQRHGERLFDGGSHCTIAAVVRGGDREGSRSCINDGNFPPRFMFEVSMEAYVLTKDSATRASESGSP